MDTGKKMSDEFVLGGRTLVMRPITLKNLRKLTAIISSGADSLSGMTDSTIEKLVGVYMDKFKEIVHIFFPDPPNGVLTDDFIEENLDLVMARQIFEKAVDMNDLTVIFPFLKRFVTSTTTGV